MSHKELVLTAAVLGTEQQQVPDLAAAGNLAETLEQLRNDQNKLGRERSLLHASAIVCLYEKAGHKFAKFNEDLPAAAYEEPRPFVSKSAAGYLRSILDSRQDLLPEWLQLVLQQDLRVPYDCIVELLQIGSQNVSIRKLVTCSVGLRAQWLCQFNPSWEFVRQAAEFADADIAKLQKTFDFGSIDERVWALKEIRRIDPDLGLELLRAVWKTDRAEDRARLLAACEIALSLNDDNFIETEALNDKRKEVRQVARDLLFKLPDSSLSLRAKQRAFACLSVENPGEADSPNYFLVASNKRKVRLEIEVPEVCDKSMQRDGIALKPLDSRLGGKAWWLCQIVEQVDPDKLLQRLGLSAEQYLDAISRSAWQVALGQALSSAVVRFRNKEWAKILLQQERVDNAEHLFAILDSFEQENILSRALAERGYLLVRPVQSHYDSEALNLLMRMKHFWSANFSRIMLKTLRTHIAQKNNFIFMDYILRHVATHMDTELWASVQESWSTIANIDPTLARMMSTLAFRKEMRDALIKDSS